MKEWNNGRMGWSLFIAHHSNIPTFHYPSIPIYTNFASAWQQKRDIEISVKNGVEVLKKPI
jgi:hypothetical protein